MGRRPQNTLHICSQHTMPWQTHNELTSASRQCTMLMFRLACSHSHLIEIEKSLSIYFVFDSHSLVAVLRLYSILFFCSHESSHKNVRSILFALRIKEENLLSSLCLIVKARHMHRRGRASTLTRYGCSVQIFIMSCHEYIIRFTVIIMRKVVSRRNVCSTSYNVKEWNELDVGNETNGNVYTHAINFP